jgi:hypothetical protein
LGPISLRIAHKHSPAGLGQAIKLAGIPNKRSSDGTLISIPVKLPKKLAVLRHIASELSPDTKYPEKQLNEIIAKYHPDTAALRRHMIEYGILERDGESVYWVVDKIS